MRKNKKVLKTIPALPLVVGLLFSWFFSSPSQTFSQTATLVATVRINPLKVKVEAPSSVSVGQRFKVKAIVSNLGETKIKQAKAEIFLPQGLALKGNPEQKLGAILPNKSKTASWQVIAEVTGGYVILVKASGVEEKTGDLVEAEGTVTVQVQASTSFWRGIIRRFLARATLLKLEFIVS